MKNIIIRFNFFLILGIFIYLISTLTCCKSGKYFADYKTKKKSIDTLALFDPLIYVFSTGDQIDSVDYKLIKKLEKQISDKTNSILSGKYILTNVPVKIDSIPVKQINDLFATLDNSDEHSPEIKIPSFIQNISINIEERYCLLILYQGYYNRNYAPYDKIMKSIGTSSIDINSPNSFGSDMRVVIIDNVENNIVYCNKKRSSNRDPRLIVHIDDIISDILRPVYYK